METFRISQRQFINYFRALEVNYGSNVCESLHIQQSHAAASWSTVVYGSTPYMYVGMAQEKNGFHIECVQNDVQKSALHANSA